MGRELCIHSKLNTYERQVISGGNEIPTLREHALCQRLII